MNAASRSKLLVAVSAIVLSGVVACSNSTSGEPVGGETTSTTSKTAASTSTTTSSSRGGSAEGPLKDVDPCDLLPGSTATELGLPGQGKPRRVVEARVCGWQVSGGPVVDVAIFDKRGLKDIVGATTELPMIGRHRAMKQTEVTCAINLGVTESSRVVVQAIHDPGAMDKACEISMRVAQRVEPLLP